MVQCSYTFELILTIVLILLAVGGIIAWIKLRKSGNLSNCLGVKGNWTETAKTISQNLLVQIANAQKVPITQDCIDCVLKAGEAGYDPQDFIVKLPQLTSGIETILTKCNCGLN